MTAGLLGVVLLIAGLNSLLDIRLMGAAAASAPVKASVMPQVRIPPLRA